MSGASKTILICDDDQGMRDTIAAILQAGLPRPDGRRAARRRCTLLKQEDVDVLLLDVRLPGISGFDVLRIVKENYSLIECIMISAINEVETAVQAMKHGAYHYITKDFDYDELRSLVRNACERQDLNRQVITLSAQVAEQGEREFLIGPSQQIRDIVDLVQQGGEAVGDGADPRRERHRQGAARAAAPPGVGPRRRAVHRGQPVGDPARAGREHAVRPRARARSPARTSSSSASSSWRPAARCSSTKSAICGSTCRPSCCARSRRGRSSGSAGRSRSGPNFRLIVATNVDLEKAVKEGRFREDLYYRINVIPIRMPPLRDRIEDLPELARLFLESLQGRSSGSRCEGIADSALKILASYWWPGNIRELENLIERLVAVSDKEWITDEDLPLEYHFAKLDSGADRPARRCSRRRATPSSATSSCARSRSRTGTSPRPRATSGFRSAR